MDIVIYHNPDCGTSRNVLGLIRNAGLEPHVVEYLKTPPSRALLKDLIARMGVPVRSLLREKGTPYAELGLGSPGLTDDQLVDAMMEHPILINRPIVDYSGHGGNESHEEFIHRRDLAPAKVGGGQRHDQHKGG